MPERRSTYHWLLLGAGATAASWPIVVARALLAFSMRTERPHASDRAGDFAALASVGLIFLASVSLLRWAPTRARTWFLICIAVGTATAVVWGCMGALFWPGGQGIVLATPLAGLLYGGPWGLLVGVVVAAVIVILAKMLGFFEVVAIPPRRNPALVTFLVVMANFALAYAATVAFKVPWLRIPGPE